MFSYQQLLKRTCILYLWYSIDANIGKTIFAQSIGEGTCIGIKGTNYRYQFPFSFETQYNN